MKIQAAVAWEAGAELSIEEFDLDDPRDDEILVKNVAVGVCHTDDNARLGRLPVVFPIILGHEVVAVTFTGADRAIRLHSRRGRIDLWYKEHKDGIFGLALTVLISFITALLTVLAFTH